MGINMFGIIVAVISGALMSIQGVFNTGITKETSIWVSSSFVQLTAFIVCIAAWFFTGREGNFQSLLNVSNKYMLLGGVLGAFITFTVIKSMSMLGPAKSVLIIVTAQLLTAYIIELVGVFGVERAPFELRKLIGISLAVIGIIIFKWDM